MSVMARRGYVMAALSVLPPKKYADLPLENAMLKPDALNTKPHWPMVKPEMLAPPAYVTADGMTELVRRSSVTPDARKPPWRLKPDVPAHTSPASMLPAELTRLARTCPGVPSMERLL